MSISVNRSVNGQYYFRIVASNGRTLAHSETYYNKQDAVAAAYSIKWEAGGAGIQDNT